MIYYFTIYDILYHESIAQEALEHAFASIGARWWKLWSTMLQAIEHDGANAGIWLCGANATASAHASSLFMRSGEYFFVKKFGDFGKTKYFCREIHS